MLRRLNRGELAAVFDYTTQHFLLTLSPGSTEAGILKGHLRTQPHHNYREPPLHRSMGGPYSQGCARCRAQKKRCDQGQPACNRCTKAGAVCPGYPRRELSWIPVAVPPVLEDQVARKIQEQSPVTLVLEEESSSPASFEPRSPKTSIQTRAGELADRRPDRASAAMEHERSVFQQS
jgi:hypothetical protein